jgi:hypothetical protein
MENVFRDTGNLQFNQNNDTDECQYLAKKWLKSADPEFYRAGIHALDPRWRKAVERDGDYIEK